MKIINNLSVSSVILILLVACSEQTDSVTESRQVSAKKKPLVSKQTLIKDDSLVLKRSDSVDANSVLRDIDDQEVQLLEVESKAVEADMQELIQEMNDNLDNPAVREEIAERMQEYNTPEYKQKVLLLAKEKLRNQSY